MKSGLPLPAAPERSCFQSLRLVLDAMKSGLPLPAAPERSCFQSLRLELDAMKSGLPLSAALYCNLLSRNDHFAEFRP